MQLPLQITFHEIPHSEAIEKIVREKATKLDEFAKHIMGCRVVIEMPHRHHVHGNQYQVRIDINVPGEEIAVNREPTEHTEYCDAMVAIRDAFDAAGRQLEDYVRRRRHDVKSLETAPHGRISKLFPQEGYGFIETPGRHEIYFHRQAVLHEDFDRMTVGTEVAFVEEMGKKGAQASTVRVVGRHGHA